MTFFKCQLFIELPIELPIEEQTCLLNIQEGFVEERHGP